MKRSDLSDEIRAHIDEKIAGLVAEGVPESEARSRALREFGNVTLVEERSREVWGWPTLDRLWQDVRFGARMMRRNRALTAIIVATLALGIGANTAIFSVARTVLIAPLPYPQPDRLVWVSTILDSIVSAPDYFDLAAQAQSFDILAAYVSGNQNLEANGEARQTQTAALVGDVWSLTGVRPMLGRLFQPGETGSVVLSYKTFEQRFHADPRVIGRRINLDGEPAAIVGVLPPDFQFLFPTDLYLTERTDIEAFLASPFTAQNQPHAAPQIRAVRVVGRLKPGVSMAQARAEVDALMARLKQRWGFTGYGYSQLAVRVAPLQQKLTEGSRPAVLVLLAAVAFVLLIACANVANLLLARAASRQREISIRAALGASRMRVARQFLTESVMLALAGGAAGLLLARWGVDALARFGPTNVPRLNNASIDGWVLGSTLALSILTGLLFGMVPAWSFSRGLHENLKESARTASASAAARRLRAALAASEIGLALVLLAGAGLMFKSVWKMTARPPGFDPEHTVVMKVALTGERYRTMAQKQAYFNNLVQRLRSAPGVEDAGMGAGGYQGQVPVDELPRAPGEPSLTVSIRLVSEGYNRAIGLRLLEGRWLTDREPVPAAVVNESFVRQVAHGQNVIGKHAFRAAIVGVVADLKVDKLDTHTLPEIYVHYSQNPLMLSSAELAVRMRGDAELQASGLSILASQTDPTQAIYDVKTLAQALAESIAPRRFNLTLLAIFAALAMLLAAVGIYGVMSYTVAQRAQEIGVRIALGAGRGEVVRMMVRQGMLVAGVGVAAGVAAAFGLTRLMASLLFDVKPGDPATFATVTGALACAALLACWLPARRASRVDPMVALRYE